MRCENQNCDEFIVLHLGYLDYTHYILTVRFHGLEAFHKRYNINQVTFYVSYMDFHFFSDERTVLNLMFRNYSTNYVIPINFEIVLEDTYRVIHH